jgi:hypothetical protein
MESSDGFGIGAENLERSASAQAAQAEAELIRMFFLRSYESINLSARYCLAHSIKQYDYVDLIEVR